MAADTHVAGSLYILAGKNIIKYREIAVLDDTIADNAAGSEPYYFVPVGSQIGQVGLPRNDGVPYTLPPGPHIVDGELLILAVATTSSTNFPDVDTTGASSDVYNLSYWEFDRQTKTGRVVQITDETTRNTTTGVAPPTDPKLVTGVIVPTHAWGPVPPGSDWTLFGRVRIDLRTAT